MRRFTTAVLAAGVLTIPGAAQAAPTISGSYYEDGLSVFCPAATSCAVNFTTSTPSNKQVLFQRVTCSVVAAVPVTGVFIGTSPSLNGAVGRFTYVPFLPVFQVDAQYRYVFGPDITFLVGQSRFPSVTIQTNAAGNISATCIIAGTLITP
jgi:hypothetical protein